MEPHPSASHGSPDEREWTGSGLVLVIDDEAGIVRLATRLLEQLGFEVRTAADGRAGLRLFRELGSRARLVLLDRTMPGLSGEDLMTEIHRTRPDLPVVLTSGYVDPNEAERITRAGAAGFVGKPYRRSELIAAVRQALREDRRGP